MRALVVSDEVDEQLWAGVGPGCEVGLVLAAGDLPFDYLEFLTDSLGGVPCVFVPGNHDPDLSGFTRHGGLFMRAGFPQAWPGPAGAINADGRVVDVCGLRIAGLGGSVRYNEGPNQWTQAQQARRARRLVRQAARRHRRDGRGVDVLLTHAPPRGCGDGDDPPHRGFAALHGLVAALAPQDLLHGHIHPHGTPRPDRELGATRVCNVVGRHLLDIDARG